MRSEPPTLPRATGLPDGLGKDDFGGLARRVLAWTVDAGIETAVTYPLGAGIGVLFASLGTWDVWAAALIVGGVFDWAYFATFESSVLRGSPGKRLLGMTVVDLAGERLTFAHASGRYLAKSASAGLLLAGVLMIASSPRRQGLHDRMAGTLVLRHRRPRVTPLAPEPPATA